MAGGPDGGDRGEWSARKAAAAREAAGAGRAGGARREPGKAELMEQARRRDIPGRSRRDKAALRRAPDG